MKYRPEIDGLRAFAIIPVLFYHAGFSWMPGGWLGVDVFFVISGFLITGILLRDLENGEFSLTRFYDRRARRILPALTVVVLATMIAAPIFMWPWQIEELGHSVIFTNTFLANIFFEAKVDYFRTDAEQYPLIHMWSLAIEEQYYVVLPLLLAGLWKIGFRAGKLLVMIGAISAVSIMAACIKAPFYPSEAFYLIQYRAYELGIGSLAAILAFKGLMFRRDIARITIVIGLALIILSVAMVERTGSDPAVRLATLLGTAMVLLSEARSGPARAILVHPVIRFIGLISFSLYLWHQPILAFAHLHWIEVPIFATPALLILSAAMATLSWKFIETPCREVALPRIRVFTISMTALVLTSLAGIYLSSNANRIAPYTQHEADFAISPEVRASYVRTAYNKRLGRRFLQGDREKVLLIGDSYSQDFFNMAMENNAFQNVDLVTHYIPAKCQPYFGNDDVLEFIKPENRWKCRDRKSMAPPKDLLESADTIILASNWRDWSALRIQEIADYMRQSPQQDLIVIGSKSLGGSHVVKTREYEKLSHYDRIALKVNATDWFQRNYKVIQDNIGDLPFVDVQQAACRPDPTVCSVFSPGGLLLTFDGGHLTKAGAAHIGKTVFEHPLLSEYNSKQEIIQ